MVTHVSDTVCEQSGDQEGPSGEINSHQLSEEQVRVLGPCYTVSGLSLLVCLAREIVTEDQAQHLNRVCGCRNPS